ncbi:MAG: dienelactone hydrolase family protein, partial [Candidatus Shapirobacteria bacterium]
MRVLILTVLLMSAFQGVSSQSLKTVSYQDETQKLNGIVTSNAGQKLPGVLILPAWRGVDNEARQAA